MYLSIRPGMANCVRANYLKDDLFGRWLSLDRAVDRTIRAKRDADRTIKRAQKTGANAFELRVIDRKLESAQRGLREAGAPQRRGFGPQTSSSSLSRRDRISARRVQGEVNSVEKRKTEARQAAIRQLAKARQDLSELRKTSRPKGRASRWF